MIDGLLYVVVGPAEHGVVRFGADLATLTGRPIRRFEDADEAVAWAGRQSGRREPAPSVIHLQYTDALYAAHTTHAANVFTHLVRRLREIFGCLVTATLHDLPDPLDEPGRYDRRARSYRQVLTGVDAATVCSDHELARVRALFAGRDAPLPVSVVPLPLPPSDPRLEPAARPDPEPELGVFGFVYPGKGHAEALAAMAGLPPSVGFTVLGRAADGHADLVEDLASAARRQGRRCTVTGFLPDDGLVDRLRRVAVPVVPGRAVSASGSLNTWLAAGRRPVTADGGYSRELARGYPGALHLYRPGELPGLVSRGLVEPHLTWVDDPPPGRLTGPAVARAHAEVVRAALRARSSRVIVLPRAVPAGHGARR